MKDSDRKRIKLEAAQPAFRKRGYQVHRADYLPKVSPVAVQNNVFCVFSLEKNRQTVTAGDIIAKGTKLLDLYLTVKEDPLSWRSHHTMQGTTSTSSPKTSTEPVKSSPKPVQPTQKPSTGGSLDSVITALVNDAVQKGLEGHEPVSKEDLKDLVDQAVKAQPIQVHEFKLPERKPIKVDGQHQSFALAMAEVIAGNPTFVAGPAGTGKTTAFQEIAKSLDFKFFMQTPVDNKYEILGFKDAAGKYQGSEVYFAVEHVEQGGEALLLIDEIDRSFAGPLTCIHALTNGVAVFPHRTIKFDPSKLHLVATGNTWGSGADAEFVGSNKLDAATLNRYTSRIYWGYDENFETRIAAAQFGGTPEIVQECFNVRKNIEKSGIRFAWSPRDTFAHCKRRASGKSRTESFEVSSLSSLQKKDFEQLTK